MGHWISLYNLVRLLEVNMKLSCNMSCNYLCQYCLYGLVVVFEHFRSGPPSENDNLGPPRSAVMAGRDIKVAQCQIPRRLHPAFCNPPEMKSQPP